MKIGLVLPQWSGSMAGTTPAAGDVVEFGRAAEAIGIESLWLFDHFYYEPYLDFLEHGYQLPQDQQGHRMGAWECWTMLSGLAVATEQVELGTMVTNTAFRNPALLANMAETVDALSGGRVTLGLGAGDFRSEHTFHGYPWDRRVSRFEEALQIIVPMLKGERVTFDGDYYQVRDAGLLPRGLRPEGPPVLIGTMRAGPRMQRLAAHYADVWNSWLAFGDSHAENYAEMLDLMTSACQRHGRDPATLRHSVTIGLTMPGFEGLVPGATPISGSPDQVAGEIQKYVDLGVDHLVVFLQPCGPAGLDWMAEVLEQVRSLV